MRLYDDPTIPAPAAATFAATLKGLLTNTIRQLNALSEGRLSAVHNAATAAPTTGEWYQGDFIRNAEPAELGTGQVVRTYQFEVATFRKGSTAPTEVTVGTNPEIRGLRLDATNETLSFEFMTPLDAAAADMQMMFQVFVPAGKTFTVGDLINLKVYYRTNPGGGTTKVDSTGSVKTTQDTSLTAPFADSANDNVIVTGGNTEYYAYMPHVFIPAAALTPGQVFYGEVSLNSIAAGNVDSIVVYQMHINYFSIETNKYALLGWVCVASGTPGTWKECRALTGG
jgi:hypothetical protein